MRESIGTYADREQYGADELLLAVVLQAVNSLPERVQLLAPKHPREPMLINMFFGGVFFGGFF